LRPAIPLEVPDEEATTVCAADEELVLLFAIIAGTSARADVHPSPPIKAELPTGKL
jgi:hypothetical protein